uniref:Uncharacterized protein n=1 Tax=Romanomermis culicivorax TaxID=13658 RepID=A0A915I4Z8_ROMCU
MDQIIGTVSNQFQAQQSCLQREIQEQVQSTNAHFAALAQQMQQLISTTTAAAVEPNPPTPRPPPVSSQFHCEEMRDIYIPNETLPETEQALAFGRPRAHIKPKPPSKDTTLNQSHHQRIPSTTTKFPARCPRDAHCPRSTHLDSQITLQMTIMIICNHSMTCGACPIAKKIAELKLLSTICIHLQSMDPQPTNASSTSSFASKTNSDTTHPIT